MEERFSPKKQYKIIFNQVIKLACYFLIKSGIDAQKLVGQLESLNND